MQMAIISVFIAFGFTMLVILLLMKWALKYGAIDSTNQRKMNRKVIPRLGGLAVFIGFATAVLLMQELSMHIVGLLIGGSLILLLGIIDDTKGLSIKAKLAGQLVAACAVAVPDFGIRLEFLANPFSDELMTLGLLSIPVTVLWIVSATNAVNLIDRLDGLAGGTTFIVSLTMATVVWIESAFLGSSHVQREAITLTIILAASVLGFLRYNFYPAQILLGNSGSMYLGFSVAILAVIGLLKGAISISNILLFVIILAVPLLDFAIINHYYGISQPDRDHLNQLLMQKGLSHSKVVLCLYGVNTALSLTAIVLTLITPRLDVLFLLMLIIAILVVAIKNN